MSVKNETYIVPDSGTTSTTDSDLWADQASLKKLWICNTTYSSVDSDLTVDGGDLPSGVDLVFSAKDESAIGDAVKIRIDDGGATGTATLVTSELTDQDRAYILYVITAYDDTSNDDIIALFASDTRVTVTGSSAVTTGSIVAQSATGLDAGKIGNWTKVVIKLRYDAKYTDLVNTNGETLDKSVPLIMQQRGLALLTASRLLDRDEGGSKALAAKYRADYDEELAKVTKHRSKSTVPSDVEPG